MMMYNDDGDYDDDNDDDDDDDDDSNDDDHYGIKDRVVDNNMKMILVMMIEN